MMQEISGADISREIIERLKDKKIPPKILAVILVGDDPTSKSFIKQKEAVANQLGVDFRVYEFDENISNDDLRKEIGRIAKQKKVGAVVVQLPLPERINKHYVLNAVGREKDVDVLGERSLGAFYNKRNEAFPPAVSTVEEIVERQGLKFKDMKVAVVGLGSLVGRPISLWLSGQCKELILLDKGSDLEELKKADLVISGVGEAGLISPEILKDGAGVIDFGYYYFPSGELSGDLDTSKEKALEHLSFYTPTPGGTGPILVAKLLENFYKLNA